MRMVPRLVLFCIVTTLVLTPIVPKKSGVGGSFLASATALQIASALKLGVRRQRAQSGDAALAEPEFTLITT
jgi:hypothetical protein